MQHFFKMCPSLLHLHKEDRNSASPTPNSYDPLMKCDFINGIKCYQCRVCAALVNV
jgi:hypothetical protein